MDDQQDDRLEGAEHDHVASGREDRFGAMVEEVGPVLVLHNRLYAENHRVPQRHGVERKPLVDQRGSVELVVAAHAKLLVVVLDDVVVQLKAERILFSPKLEHKCETYECQEPIGTSNVQDDEIFLALRIGFPKKCQKRADYTDCY